MGVPVCDLVMILLSGGSGSSQRCGSSFCKMGGMTDRWWRFLWSCPGGTLIIYDQGLVVADEATRPCTGSPSDLIQTPVSSGRTSSSCTRWRRSKSLFCLSLNAWSCCLNPCRCDHLGISWSHVCGRGVRTRLPISSSAGLRSRHGRGVAR